MERLAMNSNRNLNGLELNLTMSQDRIDSNRSNLNIDNNLRNLQLDRQLHLDREMNLERSLSAERLNNIQNNIDDRLNDRISPVDRLNNDNRLASIETESYKEQMNDIKYREYKNHLDCLRGIDGRNNDVQNEEGRGTPSTPPTPVSVGENNYHEEKVLSSCHVLF